MLNTRDNKNLTLQFTNKIYNEINMDDNNLTIQAILKQIEETEEDTNWQESFEKILAIHQKELATDYHNKQKNSVIKEIFKHLRSSNNPQDNITRLIYALNQGLTLLCQDKIIIEASETRLTLASQICIIFTKYVNNASIQAAISILLESITEINIRNNNDNFSKIINKIFTLKKYINPNCFSRIIEEISKVINNRLTFLPYMNETEYQMLFENYLVPFSSNYEKENNDIHTLIKHVSHIVNFWSTLQNNQYVSKNNHMIFPFFKMNNCSDDAIQVPEQIILLVYKKILQDEICSPGICLLVRNIEKHYYNQTNSFSISKIREDVKVMIEKILLEVLRNDFDIINIMYVETIVESLVIFSGVEKIQDTVYTAIKDKIYKNISNNKEDIFYKLDFFFNFLLLHPSEHQTELEKDNVIDIIKNKTRYSDSYKDNKKYINLFRDMISEKFWPEIETQSLSVETMIALRKVFILADYDPKWLNSTLINLVKFTEKENKIVTGPIIVNCIIRVLQPCINAKAKNNKTGIDSELLNTCIKYIQHFKSIETEQKATCLSQAVDYYTALVTCKENFTIMNKLVKNNPFVNKQHLKIICDIFNINWHYYKLIQKVITTDLINNINNEKSLQIANTILKNNHLNKETRAKISTAFNIPLPEKSQETPSEIIDYIMISPLANTEIKIFFSTKRGAFNCNAPAYYLQFLPYGITLVFAKEKNLGNIIIFGEIIDSPIILKDSAITIETILKDLDVMEQLSIENMSIFIEQYHSLEKKGKNKLKKAILQKETDKGNVVINFVRSYLFSTKNNINTMLYFLDLLESMPIANIKKLVADNTKKCNQKYIEEINGYLDNCIDKKDIFEINWQEIPKTLATIATIQQRQSSNKTTENDESPDANSNIEIDNKTKQQCIKFINLNNLLENESITNKTSFIALVIYGYCYKNIFKKSIRKHCDNLQNIYSNSFIISCKPVKIIYKDINIPIHYSDNIKEWVDNFEEIIIKLQKIQQQLTLLEAGNKLKSIDKSIEKIIAGIFSAQAMLNDYTDENILSQHQRAINKNKHLTFSNSCKQHIKQKCEQFCDSSKEKLTLELAINRKESTIAPTVVALQQRQTTKEKNNLEKKLRIDETIYLQKKPYEIKEPEIALFFDTYFTNNREKDHSYIIECKPTEIAKSLSINLIGYSKARCFNESIFTTINCEEDIIPSLKKTLYHSPILALKSLLTIKSFMLLHKLVAKKIPFKINGYFAWVIHHCWHKRFISGEAKTSDIASALKSLRRPSNTLTLVIPKWYLTETKAYIKDELGYNRKPCGNKHNIFYSRKSNGPIGSTDNVRVYTSECNEVINPCNYGYSIEYKDDGNILVPDINNGNNDLINNNQHNITAAYIKMSMPYSLQRFIKWCHRFYGDHYLRIVRSIFLDIGFTLNDHEQVSLQEHITTDEYALCSEFNIEPIYCNYSLPLILQITQHEQLVPIEYLM